LRQKGHLDRKQIGGEGVFQYFSPVSSGELMRNAVRSFVEKTLEGSVSPFVTYLADAEVSNEELAELERLVERLQSRKKEE
jgi:predicted transcriptional regulator